MGNKASRDRKPDRSSRSGFDEGHGYFSPVGYNDVPIHASGGVGSSSAKPYSGAAQGASHTKPYAGINTVATSGMMAGTHDPSGLGSRRKPALAGSATGLVDPTASGGRGSGGHGAAAAGLAMGTAGYPHHPHAMSTPNHPHGGAVQSPAALSSPYNDVSVRVEAGCGAMQPGLSTYSQAPSTQSVHGSMAGYSASVVSVPLTYLGLSMHTRRVDREVPIDFFENIQRWCAVVWTALCSEVASGRPLLQPVPSYIEDEWDSPKENIGPKGIMSATGTKPRYPPCPTPGGTTTSEDVVMFGSATDEDLGTGTESTSLSHPHAVTHKVPSEHNRWILVRVTNRNDQPVTVSVYYSAYLDDIAMESLLDLSYVHEDNILQFTKILREQGQHEQEVLVFDALCLPGVICSIPVWGHRALMLSASTHQFQHPVSVLLQPQDHYVVSVADVAKEAQAPPSMARDACGVSVEVFPKEPVLAGAPGTAGSTAGGFGYLPGKDGSSMGTAGPNSPMVSTAFAATRRGSIVMRKLASHQRTN